MSIYQLRVNGRRHTVDCDGDTPLLWALRDCLGLKGTKFGCGVAQCGACTVHLDGRAVRSCAVDVGVACLSEITTIEGLSPDGSHPVQQAWVELACAEWFCHPCQIMARRALEVPQTPTSISQLLRSTSAAAAPSTIRAAIHRPPANSVMRHHPDHAQGLLRHVGVRAGAVAFGFLAAERSATGWGKTYSRPRWNAPRASSHQADGDFVLSPRSEMGQSLELAAVLADELRSTVPIESNGLSRRRSTRSRIRPDGYRNSS